MILSYSLPKFKDLILSGEKIHTIRDDKHMRWKPGMSIQHWLGNPRNVSKNPHQFAVGECKAVQEVYIRRRGTSLVPGVCLFSTGSERWLSDEQTIELAKNDGLTIDEFREWFVPFHNSTFYGRIIHFTDKMY